MGRESDAVLLRERPREAGLGAPYASISPAESGESAETHSTGKAAGSSGRTSLSMEMAPASMS